MFFDNKLTITDAETHSTSYQYDPLARLRTETYADSTAVTYSYDMASNLKTKTDQNGSALAYGYDSLYRLTNIAITRGTGVVGTTAQTFAYDDAGRLLTVTDNNDPSDGDDNSAVAFVYDAVNLRTETQTIAGTGYSAASTYNNVNLRTDLDYPGGKSLNFAYDRYYNLTKVDDGTTDFAKFSYSAVNNVTKTDFGSGVSLTPSYDNAHRLTKLDYKLSGNTLVGFEYKLDEVGKREWEKSLHQTAKSFDYQYDNADRLTKFDRGTLSGDSIPTPNRTQVYNMDAVSNWTKLTTDSSDETRTVNSVNEYTAVGGTNYAYDDNGNLTSDGTSSYSYDAFNRLVKVAQGETTIAEYKYDGRNRRIEKAVGATEKEI